MTVLMRIIVKTGHHDKDIRLIFILRKSKEITTFAMPNVVSRPHQTTNPAPLYGNLTPGIALSRNMRGKLLANRMPIHHGIFTDLKGVEDCLSQFNQEDIAPGFVGSQFALQQVWKQRNESFCSIVAIPKVSGNFDISEPSIKRTADKIDTSDPHVEIADGGDGTPLPTKLGDSGISWMSNRNRRFDMLG